jgi:hypothetical protein
VVRRAFSFYLEDGKYDATHLEANLRDALGQGATFDAVESRTSGMKFAVTATTISDATLCLISNYNGSGEHSKELSTHRGILLRGRADDALGYKHLRPAGCQDEILLWEA